MILLRSFLIICGLAIFSAFIPKSNQKPNNFPKSDFPWQSAGLTEEEAAVHLLNRFTFGIRPGDVDNIQEMGLEIWFDQQLRADLDEPQLDKTLNQIDAWSMSPQEISKTYPEPGQILAMAAEDGAFTRADITEENRRDLLNDYREKNDLKPLRLLGRQLYSQKFAHAFYAENQLREVLTEFWFNHFNVSITDNQARTHIFSYERDAIRPNIFGSFRDILGATAQHPAMLLYLDNARSTADSSVKTMFSGNINRLNDRNVRNDSRRRSNRNRNNINRNDRQRGANANQQNNQQRRRNVGINENYARELMELHTLGVDGGYTQKDVQEVARIFTGWSVIPPGKRGEKIRSRYSSNAIRAGFYLAGDFVFRADVHDAEPKTVFGLTIQSNGMNEGNQILDILASHPETAKRIATKLAVRFVQDDPPAELIEKLTQVFIETDGDLSAMIRAIPESEAFWQESAVRSKIKTPFGLIVSALRATDAQIRAASPQLNDALLAMGQRLYGYQAPTGYPDVAEAWINSGTVLNRMKFGVNFAVGNIRGIRVDVSGLNGNREPESNEAALKTYAEMLLPAQNVDQTVTSLLPIVADPDFYQNVQEIMPVNLPESEMDQQSERNQMMEDEPARRRNNSNARNRQMQNEPPSPLSLVVGVLIGSPEFQRH